MYLTLSEMDIYYPPKHLMPKETMGYRLCKLIQYEANESNGRTDDSAWLLTTAFSQTINFKGINASVSKWNRGDVATPRKDEISIWLNGATDEQLLELAAENIGYVYIKETLDEAPLTVEQYQTNILKLSPKSENWVELKEPQASAMG